jgi:glucokinase
VKTAIGIDVGGTKVALGLVDENGRLSSPRRIANLDAHDPQALLALVASEVRSLVAAAGPVTAVGVGVCELVDSTGEIVSSTAIPWTRAEIVEALSESAPVTLDPDVTAAAVAEARHGAGRDLHSFVYMTVGTGISHCFVVEGRPYMGARGFAQLIGSSPVTLPTTQGRVTVALEAVASGPALARRYREGANAEDVLRAAENGDETAAAVVAEAAAVLGSFVALLVNVLDPHGIVVGGGLGSAGGRYWDHVVDAARRAIWAEPARALPIRRAELGAAAGVIGAGMIALDTVEPCVWPVTA